MSVWKFFGTQLGDLGSRSLSYWSGTQFTLSPGQNENCSSIRYKTWWVYPPCHAFHLIKFWRNSVKKVFFAIFFVKFQMRFSPVQHSICHILGIVGPIDVKLKEMSQLDATLTRIPLTLTLTFNFQGQIVYQECEARLSRNERDRSR